MTDTVSTHTRWLKVILGLSLAANLIFIGMSGSALFKGDRHDRRDVAPNSFLKSLSADRAAEVKSFFKGMREDRKATRQGRQQAWADVRAAMTADPFDRTALQAAMDIVAAERDANARNRYAKMVDFAENLSAQERAAFTQAMKERWERRRARRENRN